MKYLILLLFCFACVNVFGIDMSSKATIYVPPSEKVIKIKTTGTNTLYIKKSELRKALHEAN